MAEEDINIEECKVFIDEHFVSKLLGYLRGDSRSVCTNKQFMKVY